MEQELLDAFREIDYVCSGDHSRQGAMVLGAAGEAPRPLLVALHTWSFDFRHPSARGFAERCAERNWHLIFPNFRGPNNHPEGCGSELAVSDIVDAVRYMCERFPVDESRVYLTGGSGGGYGTLLLAGRHPELWAAASAWCPISDLVAWHRQCRGGKYAHYSEHIEASCGGDPQSDPAARQEFDGAERPVLDVGQADSDTFGFPFKTRDAVPIETPAWRATSFRETLLFITPLRSDNVSLNRLHNINYGSEFFECQEAVRFFSKKMNEERVLDVPEVHIGVFE